jgi:hypothetical protein
MSLSDSLYKIAFPSTYGADYGVAYMQDGKLLAVKVSMTQHKHMPGVVSVLGYNDMVVEIRD